MSLVSVAIFIAALAVLYESSRHVLNSSMKIAQITGISDVAVGFILIAFATSVPDFMVSVTAASMGKSNMAMGDVVGSTIANICLVLGAAAMVKNIKIHRDQTLESAELLLLITLAPLIFIMAGGIGMREGIVLLVVFLMYIYLAVKRRFTLGLHGILSNRRDTLKELAKFSIALAVLVVASHFVVQGGIELARFLSVPEAIIGMTLIAFGTTLPELAVDFRAIREGRAALAIGDIFGSCTINLTLVLGTSAIIAPITDGFLQLFLSPLVLLIAINSFVWYLLMRHEGIRKEHGLVFVLIYILWIMFEFYSTHGFVAS